MVNVPEQDWSYTIDEEPQILGRSADAGIGIPQQFGRVSRRHATLWRQKSDIWLRDEGSTYGTLVNGVFLKAGQPVTIKVGDRIALADVELLVVGQSSKRADPAPVTQRSSRFVECSGTGSETVSMRSNSLDLARAAVEQLTTSELDIVLWMYRGYTNDGELGRVLFRSPHTIRTHVASIFRKLAVHSRAEIVTWLKRSGGLRPDEQKQLPPAARTARLATPYKRTRSRSG